VVKGEAMERRALGGTGIQVSKIGFGLIKLGRNTGMKYPEAYDLPSDETAMGLLDTARELGINLLDTAPAYGTSEERLGALLRARGDRESWVISTKAGEEYDGVSRFDFSPGAITASCERSLRRLGTDRVELLLVHSDGVSETRFDELGTFDALEALKRRGLIRAFGVSFKTGEGARAAVERCDLVMAPYSVAAPELGWTIDHAASLGVGVLIKKGLASGRVGEGHGVPVREAVRYVFERPGVSSVVVGTLKAQNLREVALAAG